MSYQFGSSRRSEYPSIEDFLPPKNISETQSKTRYQSNHHNLCKHTNCLMLQSIIPRYQCFAYQSPNSSVCLRVNTVKTLFCYFIFVLPSNKWLKIPPLQVPLYWFANQGIVAPLLEKAGVLSFAPKAQVDFFPFHFFSFLSHY